MYLNLNMSDTTVILLAVAVVSMLLLVSIYRHRVGVVRRHGRMCAGRSDAEPGTLPGVSVVVYEHDNIPGLEQVLPAIMTQEYNGTYEVIVVSDGSGEDARDVVTRLAVGHRNIHLTFVPDEAHNLSRRKLAITLGVKAARQPYVIITTAEARIPGEDWLSVMARNFADGHDIVLGHAVLDSSSDRGIGGRARTFDRAVDAATFLGAAVRRSVYRGFGSNMGFRRELFFNCKGFAGSLNLHPGDDDMFVSRLAREGHTAVELDRRACVTLCFHNPRREHRFAAASHQFTGRHVSGGARRFMTSGLWLMWLWAGSSIMAILISLPNLLPATVAFVTGIALWVTVATAWARTIRALGDNVNPWLIPALLLTRPFRTLRHKMRAHKHRSEYYTWHNR